MHGCCIFERVCRQRTVDALGHSKCHVLVGLRCSLRRQRHGRKARQDSDPIPDAAQQAMNEIVLLFMIILSLFNFTHKLSISSHRVQRITVTLTDVVFDSVQEEQ